MPWFVCLHFLGMGFHLPLDSSISANTTAVRSKPKKHSLSDNNENMTRGSGI